MTTISNIFSNLHVNNIFGSTTTTSIQPTSTNVPPVYKNDSFTGTTNYSPLSSGGVSFPIGQIVSEDPTLAAKFDKFFLGTSDRFLRVGTNWFGRILVNMVAGNIPLFTSSTASTQISNNVNLWLGRSDLVRAVGNPYYAALLQDVGIKNVNDLSVIGNPSDQAVIAQMMVADSSQRGNPAMISPMMVSSWVATAQQLPKYF